MSEATEYVDPWQEYRAISAKLKRRLLKRPNVAEASLHFAQLSLRLQDEECLNYAGLCQMGVARCEHSVSNTVGELKGLTQAARFFLEAEKDSEALHIPGFGDNLAAAVHCYGHAIRIHLEQKHMELAACLSMELGQNLVCIGKLSESLEHFERAARLYAENPPGYIEALRWTSQTEIDIGDFSAALKTTLKLASFIVGRFEKPFGVTGDILAECEVSTVLLLLLLKQPANLLSEAEKGLLVKYDRTWPIGGPSALDTHGGTKENPFASQCILDEERFLLLQSIYIAVKEKEVEIFQEIMSDLWHLVGISQQELLLKLVELVEREARM